MVNSQIHDVTVLVGRGGVTRVIHSKYTATKASSQKYPMSSIVDIGDKAMASREAVANLRLSRGLLAHERGVAELVHRCPVNVAASRVTAVAGQPRIEVPGVVVSALGSDDHGDRRHSAAGRADGGTSASA